MVGCLKTPYTLIRLTENSLHVGVMETYCNSISNCSKSQQRKDSLRLTIHKDSNVKNLNTLILYINSIAEFFKIFTMNTRRQFLVKFLSATPFSLSLQAMGQIPAVRRSVIDQNWVDPTRQRNVPVRLRWPD